MADQKLTALTSIPSVDRTADLVYIVKNSGSVSYKVTPNSLLGITGAPVGDTDTQTLSAKTLTSPIINGATFSGTLSGTYTIGGTPTFPAAVVTLTGSQTLTNKILTSPTINTPTITNASITADALTGFSSANTGTIYGASITAGVIASAALSNSVNTAALQNASVTPNKLATGATSATVATAQTTTSSSYTDLSTVGPSVTVTVGSNGIVVIGISALLSNSASSGAAALMSFVVSGANTLAVGTQPYVVSYQPWTANSNGQFGSSWIITGLNAGSTTFKIQYAIFSSGTASFTNRNIWVLPL